jgi:hypothetical protein
MAQMPLPAIIVPTATATVRARLDNTETRWATDTKQYTAKQATAKDSTTSQGSLLSNMIHFANLSSVFLLA